MPKKKSAFRNVRRGNDCQMKDAALWGHERFVKDVKTEIKTLSHKIKQSKAGFEFGTTAGGCMIRCFEENEFRLDLVPDYVTIIHQLIDPETGKRFYRYVDTYGRNLPKEEVAEKVPKEEYTINFHQPSLSSEELKALLGNHAEEVKE